MKHKYVIIDSSKENHNSVDAKFKVQIPQGITGTTRVCVKSFSMPNSYHNIYGDLKTAKFVEFYRPTSGGDWVYEVFSFSLKEGYTETDNLFSEIPGCLWCASLHRENYEPWQSFASRWLWLLFLHNMFTLLPLFEPLGYHPLGH